MRARVALPVALLLLASTITPVAVALPVDADSASERPVEPAASQADSPAVDRRLAATAAATGTGTATGTDTNVAAPGDGAATITERIELDRTPADTGTVQVTLSYDLPDSVTQLEIKSWFLTDDGVAVADKTGFGRSDERTFQWDGATETPEITLDVTVSRGEFGRDSLGVETDDWAFASLPNPYVSWHYRGTAPSFEEEMRVAGDGYASEAFGLDGAESATANQVGDVAVTVAVAPGARPDATTGDISELYRVGDREFDFAAEYAESGVFVLPADAVSDDAPAGYTTRYSFWIRDDFSTLDDVESTPVHEYVHTRFGNFGDGSSAWLTEASAEYYGKLLAMNTGRASWSSFGESLQVRRDGIRSSTLSKSSTWSSRFVPYEKGSLVLAALDAQIRDRTGGVKSLQDVLEYRFSDDQYGKLETYENFSAAVVDVTNDESMRDWLDRYVASGKTPPVPDDPESFVVNTSMDSDGDGLENGVEASTNPFEADSDDDGVDDGDDDYPTDSSRYEDEESTETADENTADENSTTTTTEETTTTTATTETATTSTTTQRTATTESPTTTTQTTASTTATTTELATSTGGASGESSAADSQTDDGPDSEDGSSTATESIDAVEVSGFGPVIAGLALLATALLVGRRARNP